MINCLVFQAQNRKWSVASCLSRFINDMKAMCKAYTDNRNGICLQQVSKFDKLRGLFPVPAANPSPVWCADSCIPQNASPDVVLEIGK